MPKVFSYDRTLPSPDKISEESGQDIFIQFLVTQGLI